MSYTASETEEILEQVERELGPKLFIPVTKLVALGLIGSDSGLRKELDRGALPILYVSSHRRVIPRKAILEYIRRGLTNEAGR